MSIDLKTIKHISKLSRISVDEQKAEKLAGDLNSIFKFIEKLNELKIDLNRDDSKNRIVCDFIAGMTDNYARTIYEKYS